MSVCSLCGEGIRWAVKAEGGRIPLDYLGHVIVIGNDGKAAAPQPGYRRHVCLPENVEALAERTAEARHLREDQMREQRAKWAAEQDLRQHLAAHREELEAARAEYEARAVSDYRCERCLALRGQPCWNLTDVRRHEEVIRHIQHPHRGRGPAWVVPAHLQPPGQLPPPDVVE